VLRDSDPMNQPLSRRIFASRVVGLVASTAVFGQPRSSNAQQPASPRRIGVLMVAFGLESKAAKQFRLGLRDAGYVEGRGVIIEWRSANGDYNRIPSLAADLNLRIG